MKKLFVCGLGIFVLAVANGLIIHCCQDKLTWFIGYLNGTLCLAFYRVLLDEHL